MTSRKQTILITAQLLMAPDKFKKFEDYFAKEYEELCADVFEWTIRGMGDHATTVTTIDATKFDCVCSCGKAEFRGVTLRTLYRQWSDHVLRANLDKFAASSGGRT